MRKHTFYQVLSSIAACLILFHMGVWRGYLAVVIAKFKAAEVPISVPSENLPWIVAFTDVGTVLTPFPVGYLMNRYGRLFVLRLAFISFLPATPLILSATTPYQMYLASLLVGFGIGVGLSTPALYIAEIAKPNLRGSLGSIGGVAIATGIAVTLTFGPHMSFEALTWAILPGPFVGLFLTFFTAESPYYHLIRNNENRAAEALAQVRSTKKPNEKNAELESIRKRVDDNLKDPTSFFELFSKKSNKKALVIVLVLSGLRVGGGYAFNMVYGLTTLPADWDPKISMSAYSWSNILFGFLGMSLVDRFGRKPLLIISLGGLCLVTGVSAAFYYCHQKTSLDVSQFAFVPHVCVLLFSTFYPIGMDPVSQILRGELLSVKIKGQVSAMATIVTSTTFFIVTIAFPAVNQHIGLYFMFVIFSILNFLGIIFTIKCVFETRGKTLEDIQNRLNT